MPQPPPRSLAARQRGPVTGGGPPRDGVQRRMSPARTDRAVPSAAVPRCTWHALVPKQGKSRGEGSAIAHGCLGSPAQECDTGEGTGPALRPDGLDPPARWAAGGEGRVLRTARRGVPLQGHTTRPKHAPAADTSSETAVSVRGGWSSQGWRAGTHVTRKDRSRRAVGGGPAWHLECLGSRARQEQRGRVRHCSRLPWFPCSRGRHGRMDGSSIAPGRPRPSRARGWRGGRGGSRTAPGRP